MIRSLTRFCRSQHSGVCSSLLYCRPTIARPETTTNVWKVLGNALVIKRSSALVIEFDPDTELPKKASGRVGHIFHYDENKGFHVFNLESGDTVKKVIGNLPRKFKTGDRVELEITGPEMHSIHGEQYKVHNLLKHFEAETPRYEMDKTKRMMEYLGATYDNIGPKRAKLIVEAFGDETFQVLDEDPERLLTVNIPANVVDQVKLIKEMDSDRTWVRELFTTVPLLSLTTCQKFVQKWGTKSVDAMTENPYRLVEFESFTKVDKLAKGWFDIESDNPHRFHVCVDDLLKKRHNLGDTATPRYNLIKMLVLNYQLSTKQKATSLLEDAVQNKRITETNTERDPTVVIQTNDMAGCETSIATDLKEHVSTKVASKLSSIDAKSHLDSYLSSQQIQAIQGALTNKISIVTGGPGTGKTEVCKSLVRIAKSHDLDIKLAAPTGKASHRMSKAADHTATTIHRLLGIKYIDEIDRPDSPGRTINADIVVIDEASMLDTYLFQSLVSHLPENCNLVLIGDSDQLPSVGPGNTLQDLIDSKLFPETRLEVVHRFAETSDIVKYSTLINKGEAQVPPSFNSVDELDPDLGVQFLHLGQDKDLCPTLKELFENSLPKLGLGNIHEDVQILIPGKKRKQAGTNAVNEYFQAHLNHESWLPHINKRFKRGDKVMQTKNNYDLEVFNGFVGVVAAAQPSDRDLLVVEYPNDEDNTESPIKKNYDESSQAELALAYACTVHKSQGSEYPVVIIVLTDSQGRKLLSRRLLYTALTRGKERVILVGQESAYKAAVENNSSSARCTFLLQRLLEE